MGTTIIKHLQIEDRFVRFCDFCGTTADEATILIASPNGAHICDLCVSISLDIIAANKPTEDT